MSYISEIVFLETMNRVGAKQQAKRTKLSYPCRVCVNECTMEQESIQCNGCYSWLHQNCVNMSLLQYVDYSEKTYLQFFCRCCTSDSNGNFNFRASLACIASQAPDVNAMRLQAESENKLMNFYNILLRTFAMPSSNDICTDKPSAEVLQKSNQWLLQHFVPAAVGGDGNCMFHALSLALYGHEALHHHLRLLTAIEVLLYPSLYDASSTEYYSPYRADNRLVLSAYNDFVQGFVVDLLWTCTASCTTNPQQEFDFKAPCCILIIGSVRTTSP